MWQNPLLKSQDAKTLLESDKESNDADNDRTSLLDGSVEENELKEPEMTISVVKKDFGFTFSCIAPLKAEDVPETKEFDNIIVFKDLATRFFYFGVFNPHGSSGSEVVSTIKKFIIQHLTRSAMAIKNLTSKSQIKKFLANMISMAESDIYKKSIDVKYSGCTINHLFVYKNHFFTINIGSSRAVLYRGKPGSKLAIELTTDHVPENKEERYRVYKHGGIIKRWEMNNQKSGPLRIWDKMLENGPGIRVTRSIGDDVASQMGVISKPEIQCLAISEHDSFVIIATEAIFKSLHSTQLCYYIERFLKEYPNKLDSAAQLVINKANEKNKTDDELSDTMDSEIQFGYAKVKDSAVIVGLINH